MLRPATPLTILLFISFVLLLISVISTPIVKGIPIARNGSVNFGVFGWCKDSGECSKIQVGWNTDDALSAGDDDGFNIPSSTRHSLSSLLIVHPIAALFNLIVLALAAAAHLHSPSHSARYLLALLILLLPTLLITLLAFLVDILLFVPHLHWGGWIVLASTILITASGVVTCAMRRTLVSRKARKKRIAENAEMSGANFYARQAEESKMDPQMSTESKAPMVNGGPGADHLPAFATYAQARQSEERPRHGPSPIDPVSATSPIDSGRYYGAPRSRSNSRPRQEDFGAPLGASRSYENVPPMPTPNRGGYGSPRGGYPARGATSSRGSMNSRGPSPSAYRGRGGYPARGRGGYPSGSTTPGMPPPVMIPAGMSRRPPPGYGPQSPDEMQNGYNPSPVSNGPMYPRAGEPGFEPPSPSNYGSDINPIYGGAPYGSRAQSPARHRLSPYGSRAQSPAGRMPHQDMPPAMPPVPDHYAPVPHQRPHPGMDSDVLGMVEMPRAQPHRQPSGPQEYIPARAGWTDGSHDGPHAGPHSPVRQNRPRLNSGGSDYVEDVDPRFAEPSLPTIAPSAPPPEAFDHAQERSQVPSLLVPGHHPNDPSPASSSSQIQVPRTSSYDELHSGARSPTVESETSNFTSVSQRPMNPNWQPGHGGEFNSFGPGAHPRNQQPPRRQDMLFAGNPDFEIPGMGPPRIRGGGPNYSRGRGGYGPRQAGPMRPPPASVLENMGADGRYPGPMPPQSGVGGGVMREI